MIDQRHPTTIERSYPGHASEVEGPQTTTSCRGFFVVAHEIEDQRKPMLRIRNSGASVLLNYLEQAVPPTEPLEGLSPTTVTVGGLFVVVTHDSVRAEQPRPITQRNAALIALLDEWLADDSGYDESTWPELKKSIEESRTSTRKRFSE